MSIDKVKMSSTRKGVLALMVLLVIASCSEQGANQEVCAITVDSVSIIDSMELEGTTYYLVHRISGWSDKTEILELYDSKPLFDHCSKSNVDPIYGDSLEMSQTISHVFLNKKENRLDIVYSEGSPDKSHNANLKLEIR